MYTDSQGKGMYRDEGKENMNKNKNNEEFDAFLEKEILTANRYDGTKETEEKEEKQEKQEGLRYEDAGIDTRILRAVRELGFEHMTPIQEQAIPLFMTGRDIIGQAQTGTGKTAAFGIPILQKVDPQDRSLQAVILCPTRELAMQAADELRKFAKYMDSVKVLPVYGGQEIYKQIKNLKTGVQIVVGTPGRVMDHMRRHTLKFDHVHTIVLDEADEMLNMGFREDIETILKEMPQERQTGLFSATMPKPILDITKTYQKDAAYIKMTPKEVTIPLIKQAYYQVRKQDKEEVLCRLIDYYDPKRALIFCNTKRMVDELTEHLKGRGYEVEGLHGDLTQGQRDTVMNLFRGGRTNILIATDVAARGIDVSDVEAVYNYDVPEDIEYYVHRIGRTGRAGKTGRSFTLVVGREAYKIRDIERICHTKIRERKIPNAADITARKSEKILKEAYEVIEGEDISRAMESILDAVALGQYSATQIAAAFMKMKLGDEPQDIRTEKFFFEKKPFQGGRGGKGGRNERTDGKRGFGGKDERKDGRSGKPGEKNNGNGGRNGASGEKNNGNGGKSGFGAKGGKKTRDWDSYLTKGEKERAKDKFHYENGKPKDVRRDGRAYGGKRESDYEPRYGGLRIKTKYDT